MKFFSLLFKIFENYGKYRAMTALRALPEKQLTDIGISPELLAAGVGAWPWAAQEDNWEPRRSEFQKPIPAAMGQVTVSDQNEVSVNTAQSAA